MTVFFFCTQSSQGDVTSTSGIDHRDTWTVRPFSRDGALGQRTNRPNLALPVLGTVHSVSGPIDRTWSTGAWDGALGVLVPEPRSTQGHVRPCLQAYHGIPHRDNTAIPARNAKPGSTKNCDETNQENRSRKAGGIEHRPNSSYNRAQCRDRTQGTGSPMRCRGRVTAL